jgi:protein-tyrosine-phosphatase
MSAGLSTTDGYGASSGSCSVCSDAGLSLSRHKTRRFTAELARGATIIAMTEGHLAAIRRIAPQSRSMTLSQWADGTARDIADPCMGTPEEYQACFDQIKEYIDKGFRRTIRSSN